MSDQTPDVLDQAADLEDRGVTEYQQLLAEIAETDATYQADRNAKAQRAADLERRFAQAAAERQHAEQATAAREAARIAEARAAEVAARNAQLTAQLTDQCELAVQGFYTWLAAAPPVDGPVRIITRTDPNYRGAVLAMITDCHDPRLRYCRIVGPAPLRFA